MANIDQILQAAEQQIVKLAESQVTQYKDQALADGQNFLQAAKADLAGWTNALETGELDSDDFESLVRGEQDLAEMNALKQAGLAQVAIDTFTNGVINIVINAAFAAIKV